MICDDCIRRLYCIFNYNENRNKCSLYESDTKAVEMFIDILREYLDNKEKKYG